MRRGETTLPYACSTRLSCSGKEAALKWNSRIAACLLLTAGVAALLGCPDPGAQSSDDDEPVACTYPDTPATAPEIEAVLEGVTARHNYWRALVGLDPLEWNSSLAADAQAWAENLDFSHDPNRHGDSSEFTYVGENIYWSSATASTAVDAADSWASERADYDFGTPFDGGDIGAYGPEDRPGRHALIYRSLQSPRNSGPVPAAVSWPSTSVW